MILGHVYVHLKKLLSFSTHINSIVNDVLIHIFSAFQKVISYYNKQWFPFNRLRYFQPKTLNNEFEKKNLILSSKTNS